MMRSILSWMGIKWEAPDESLIHSYRAVFNNLHGQVVLKHLMDSVYCQVYRGSDPIELATHNGRRSVVHEILRNLDMSENPGKYDIKRKEQEVDV